MRRQKPRALICNSANLQDEAVLESLRGYLDEGGIAVCFDWPVDSEVDSVIFDREHNTYLAAHHLVSRGHRDIALCVPQVHLARQGRISGLKRALREVGAQARDEWIVSMPSNLEPERQAVDLARWYLELKFRPTGICIVNDALAATFAAIVGRHGVRVPADLSIVGHDNRAIAELGALPLTSVSRPVEAIAREPSSNCSTRG